MKHFLRSVAVVTVLFFLTGLSINASNFPRSFDLSTFYEAIAGNDTNELNSVLTELKQSDLPGKEAYEGTILMKKSGMLSKAKEKLSVFKSGRAKLEAAIQKDPGNCEYRFLRLIIQENVPKVVKYKSNIKEDSTLIRASYKTLSPIVQQAVKDYSKKSKTLTPSDF